MRTPSATLLLALLLALSMALQPAAAKPTGCTTCHHEGAVLRPPSPHPITLTGGHRGLSCTECHTPPSMSVEEPVKLCSRCHPRVVRDYEEYVHGGYMLLCRGPSLPGRYLGFYTMKGLICLGEGETTHRPCLSCHNPHHPHYTPPRSLPAPPRPGRGGWGVLAAGLAALLAAIPVSLAAAWRRG